MQAELPIREKFRILLQMQRMYLPLIEEQRPLKSWENPGMSSPKFTPVSRDCDRHPRDAKSGASQKQILRVRLVHPIDHTQV